ncbi:MAG: DNA repair protein RadA [Candidatus Levybacteria bacterium]|nr:DNA repair protein RadA [Candidatus Levybacteria bacterium]
MKKASISFICQECGYDTPQWMGKCPECGAWNSLREFKDQRSQPKAGRPLAEKLKTAKPKSLSEITSDEKNRISTGFSEMDGVLGGGIVPGSVTLLAGDPGIGKSTLLLQLAINLSNVLYISAEESEEQVKMRASRLLVTNKNDLLLLSTTDTDTIIEIIEKQKPSLAIIDSIQTIESANIDALSGAVSQVRYAAQTLIKVAKMNNISVIIVGHVTKEGMVAGPMVLSHMVDTLLFLEGEKTTQTRLLRSLKNRFGSIDEVGVFTLAENGMQEVRNPEQIFLTKHKDQTSGSVLSIILEGTRTFLIELQALVVFSKLPIPRRVASGFDARRLELLLAILQKHARLPLDTMDVFVNVAGGIKVVDPAVDIALCLAVFSSLKNISLSHAVGISEVGLLGELRRVSMLEKRIKEAQKLGFKQIISAKKYNTIEEVLKSVGK